MANSKWVKLTIGWRGTPSTVPNPSYVQDGHPVALTSSAAAFTCMGGLDWPTALWW